MDKGVVAMFLATCLGAGSCMGGFENWSQSNYYRTIIKDPGFYHLVDDVGNPVSQDFYESND